MKFIFLLIVYFTFSVVINVSQSEDDFPRVKISDGELKGTFLKSRNGKSYSAFLGIPFAKPPKRFKLAEAPEPWNEIKDASKPGNVCFHNDIFTKGTADFHIRGSEDCLFVNVHIPPRKSSTKLPVMVFIHGGGFLAGASTDYGADYFMDEDVILVTFNYRLGPLGFLSTEDTAVEANLGLKDQLLALKWVKKNIEDFGGDVKQITLFGESAGSASVHYHILSPLSTGLFTHAILQSGSALNAWAFTKYPAKNAFALGNKLGCNTDKSVKLLECLQEKSAKDIVTQNLAEWFMDPIVVFSPTVDVEGSEQVLLPDLPINLLKAGKFTKVPTIFTACEDEGLLFHSATIIGSEKLKKDMNEDFLKVFPITFLLDKDDYSKSQLDSISTQTKEFYFGKEDIGQRTFQNLTNLYSDRLFVYGIDKSVALHAKFHTVYSGILAYKGATSFASAVGLQGVKGVTHGDDLPYLFNMPHLPQLARPVGQDERVSKIFVKVWATFASTGKPAHELLTPAWKPLDSSKLKTKGTSWFQLKYPPKVLQNPFKARREFWDGIFEKYDTVSKKEEL